MNPLLSCSFSCLPLFFLAGGPALARDYHVRDFQRLQLTDTYFCEGASFGDLNRDGTMDIVAGPYWYAGPDFKVKREIYPPKPQNRQRYADNFFSFVHDFDGNGWNDVLVVGFPGTPAAWYENPRDATAHWTRHEVFDRVSNESPHFTNLVGDPRPELVCTRQGRFGYVSVNWERPETAWKFTPISDAVAAKRFGHGLGVGDIDGDGRLDVVSKDGWYQQPASLDGDWPFHGHVFARAGGAQMYVYDVDGDGDNDVISSLAAHDHGLAWFEHKRQGAEIHFERHLIMGRQPHENRYGVVFSELHAVDLHDMDGDGLKDIVTGKTYWSHHTRTPSWHDGAVVYWFRLERRDGEVDFVPHRADDDSGIGRQVVAGDVNGDGLPDIVSANMKGTFVLLQRRREVSQEEWARAQPAVHVPPTAGRDPEGVLPRGPGGRRLNLDFEDGTLKDWTVEGDAFKGQPVAGEIDQKRKWGEGKRAKPQGRYWIGGFEKTLDDAPRGTLTSAAFTVTHPYVSFRVGGGYHLETRVEIVRKDSGKVVFRTHGRGSETMLPEVVDMRAHQGRDIFIRLVDDHGGGFGHLNFDDFRFHEKRPVFRDSVILVKTARD
ncbi:MAG: VCBS repeat-containing protein [Planctomycetota bacterium]|nr:VCBS repeat-containing protein [Planctomycetota bacterium]